MDDTEDELRTRRGKFLEVERTADGYRETSLKGGVSEFAPNEQVVDLSFDGLALHTTAEIGGKGVRDFLTGTSCQEFRAIGTEGSYKIVDVSFGSQTSEGTAIIREVYAPDGHAMRSQMWVGLSDDVVKGLGERLPGTLRLEGIEKRTFYSSGTVKTVLLDHWRDHVVSENGSDSVIAEWKFKFSTVTLSPEGYSKWFGFHRTSRTPATAERSVTGSIAVHFSDGHALQQSLDGLAERLTQILKATKERNWVLFVIAIALVCLALRRG